MKSRTPTYTQAMTGTEAWSFVKAIGFPLVIMLFAMYTVDLFGAFGTAIVLPATAVMFGLGTLTAMLMPSQRKSINTQNLAFVGIYCGTLIVLRLFIYWVSNATTEQIMASYSQSITMSQSSSIPGYLQNFLWISAVMTPIGRVVMLVGQIFKFRHSIKKSTALKRLRSIRENNGQYEK